MSPLVVALTLAVAAPPSLPPPPQVAFQVERPRLSPIMACHDIDPSFVRYVAPPQGAGPLWAIVGDSDPRARTLAKQPLSPPRSDCPRLTAASARR
jgi:hypothetical protein